MYTVNAKQYFRLLTKLYFPFDVSNENIPPCRNIKLEPQLTNGSPKEKSQFNHTVKA